MKSRAAVIGVMLLSLTVVAFQQEPFAFRVVATGLQNPWELAWGPDDHLWVTERVGKQVSRVNPADGLRTVALTIPEVVQTHSQDGLLGMALHSGMLRGTGNDFVYLAYTYDADPGPDMQHRGKVRRYTYDRSAGTLQSPVDLLTGLPAGSDHVAFRLAFGPDQKLYLTVGDQGANWLQNYCLPNHAQDLPTEREVRAQDWTKYEGKTLRVNLDGSIPADNPVLRGVRSHIYSYGHRNPQGLAFGPGGRLYSSEHGPDTDDEFNLLEAGRNYGWPHVAGYNDDRVYVYARWSASAPAPCNTLKFSETVLADSVPWSKESSWSSPDFKPPLQTFFTVAADYRIETSGSATIAPGGMDVYTAAAIPGWANSAFLLSLKSGLIYRVKLSADGESAVGEPTRHLKTTNRYRDIALHPNGRTIFLATDNTGASQDESGRTVRNLANPGAVIAFTYESTSGR